MPASTGDKENVFACSLKNGFHQLINSISVEVSNMQIVNLTSFTNLDVNYRILSTCSREDELNFLPSINFAKDTAESIYYTDVSGSTGLGESNNIIKQNLWDSANGWGAKGWNANAGRLQRCLNTSFDPVDSPFGSANTRLTSETSVKAVGKNYAIKGTVDTTWYILATIPLKIIHDVFKKIPLTKGMYMRLILNLNTQCQSTVTISSSKFSKK